MKRIALLACSVACAIVITGCFKHMYTVGSGAPSGAVQYKQWHTHWFFGLIGETNVDVAQICPSGNATIYEETTFLNGLIRALIGFIYAPTTVEVRCADGSTGKIELTKDEVARVITSPHFRQWVADVAPERLGKVILAQRSFEERIIKTAANDSMIPPGGAE